MLDIHREKTQMSTPEYSRRLRKTPPERWGPPTIRQGWAPRPDRDGRPGSLAN